MRWPTTTTTSTSTTTTTTTSSTTTTTGDGPHLSLALEPYDPDSVIKPITKKDCLPKLAINPNNLLAASDNFEYEQQKRFKY